ncbi:6-bladed beta-propeller [Phenylobacterium sp.]|uniref:6-bladed beta-propeller n=1 Tax=Phenylobacterium sp. TaxID=1871053 RepID=UPI0025CBDF90|nr:6-bladed beta-propeller [Phenylobacterium sp.]
MRQRRRAMPAIAGGLALLFALAAAQSLAQPPASGPAAERAAADLRARIEASPKLPFVATTFAAKPPRPGWESGMVSWMALDKAGDLIELQRGDKADPVVVLDRQGKVLRSWGAGGYAIPHAIRIDPLGDIWTVDAAASRVIKYSPTGKVLMTIDVGEQPQTKGPFNGTSDIAFGPNGRLFITDGYGNARVLEYSAEGKRLRQWGEHGAGPGQFHLPHALQIGVDGTVYVADRENGRIEKFDLDGRFLGEIDGLGRTYSIKLVGDVLWAGMAPFTLPTGAPGWVVKIDARTGKLLGHLDVDGEHVLHGVEVTAAGEPITTAGDHVIWFKPARP